MGETNPGSNGSSGAVGTRTDAEARKLSAAEGYVRCLLHAYRCDQPSCPLAHCRPMKRVLRHTRRCARRAAACPTCRQLVGACCRHARHCRRAECPAPFCARVKLKLAREDRLSRLKARLRRFFRMLGGPNTPEKRGRVLFVLRASPSLVSALLELRRILALRRSAGQPSPTAADRRQPNESAIRQLVHASRCRDSDCRLPKCRPMKRVVRHIRTCRRRTSGGCPVCKRLVALGCDHAKHCAQDDCSVPFCSNIKRKLRAR